MKYIVTRSDGTPIPDDEPCFVIRAQDAFAVKAIQEYINLTLDVVSNEMIVELLAHRETVRRWQHKNRIKIPD